MDTNRATSNRQPDQTAEQVKENVKDVVNETRKQAEGAVEQVQDQVRSVAQQRKEQAANQLDSVAEAFRLTGKEMRNRGNTQIAGYSESVAQQIERAAGYVNHNDISGLLRDTKDLARRQPELFLGGAFTLGLLAARFFKSSSPEPDYRSGYRSGSANSSSREFNRPYRGPSGGYPAGESSWGGTAQYPAPTNLSPQPVSTDDPTSRFSADTNDAAEDQSASAAASGSQQYGGNAERT